MNGRHALALVAAALLVAAGGCSALSGSASPPPGFTDDDVTSTSALIEAHTEALQDQSFTVRMTTSIRPVNEEYVILSNSTQRIDPTGTFSGYLVSETSTRGEAPEQYAQSPDEIAAWRDGEVTYRRTLAGNDSTYRRVGLLNSSVKLSDALGRTFLLALDDRENATVTTVQNGSTQLYRVTANLNDTRISSNRTMELLVRPNGVVRELKLDQTLKYQSGTRRISRTLRFIDVGETAVERPDWYSRAVNATR